MTEYLVDTAEFEDDGQFSYKLTIFGARTAY